MSPRHGFKCSRLRRVLLPLMLALPSTVAALKAPDPDALQTPPQQVPAEPPSTGPAVPAKPASPKPTGTAPPEKIKADSAVSFPVDI